MLNCLYLQDIQACVLIDSLQLPYRVDKRHVYLGRQTPSEMLEFARAMGLEFLALDSSTLFLFYMISFPQFLSASCWVYSGGIIIVIQEDKLYTIHYSSHIVRIESAAELNVSVFPAHGLMAKGHQLGVAVKIWTKYPVCDGCSCEAIHAQLKHQFNKHIWIHRQNPLTICTYFFNTHIHTYIYIYIVLLHI